ncbi:hypothetical protein Stube_09420 [Streptomyces tubercidicus]|uniref:Uncharacterized protein n=1 Tax=Streptomyces tubercidicus TaxID=47759 RepID=A0A640UKQ1_9ACTN|nr:hypothetical protein Stube_09420 [Streptomyces tubercidicus]
MMSVIGRPSRAAARSNWEVALLARVYGGGEEVAGEPVGAVEGLRVGEGVPPHGALMAPEALLRRDHHQAATAARASRTVMGAMRADQQRGVVEGGPQLFRVEEGSERLVGSRSAGVRQPGGTEAAEPGEVGEI